MTESTAREQQRGRGPGRPWPKGTSGNPAGRKPDPNRAKTLSAMLAIIGPGAVSPLEHLLRTMNDPEVPADRHDAAARDALPHCHSKPRANRPSPA
jgi:hypothetical protein